ncbi:hypothetical protein HK097_004114 [Rhizophlyctis rosea]|uniref:NAD(P)-binding protein n=1 Tax=Rhizophlyctis rosea TaxID=64517 RepID=A0AAD5X3N1_9FUNG|nr:hypothetical protein HK097_004114 [Rhizophlyctis rosea]
MSIHIPTGLIAHTHHDIYPAIDACNPSSGLGDSAVDRTVVITGAGRGIGRSIALNYAKANAKIIVIAARTASQLDEVEIAIKAVNAACTVLKHPTDISNEESVKALIAAAAAASAPNAPYTLINNAAHAPPPTSILDSDPKTWKQVWDVNVFGTFLTAHYLLPHLSSTNPTPHYIINVSSIGSRLTRQGLSAYQSSKTAINRFTDFLQLEHGESHNLVTFAVHPGTVPTELGKECVPEELHHLFTDSPELMGGFSVWLGSGKVDWAKGRYLECKWDVDEILAVKEKVVSSDMWKTSVSI